MRCTRCDGLAVPQAVGIAPSGKVVFGYCVQCLADTNCRLVEVPARGLGDLPLTFSATDATPTEPPQGTLPAAPTDQSRWILGVVAFLMISWGLIVLAAGLAITPRPDSETSPFGNGTTTLLGFGGIFSALLGLALLVLVAYRETFPGLFLLSLLSWLTFAAAVGILLHGILDYQPRRNVLRVLGVSVAILISVVSRLLERSQRRALRSVKLSPTPKAAPAPGKSSADGPTRLL